MKHIKYNVNVCDRVANEVIIHLTKECPNNCAFCIDKRNHYKWNKTPDFDNIKNTFLTIKDEVQGVTITGGEPLLYLKQVVDLVDFIRTNSSVTITIDTSIPVSCFRHQDKFFELIDKVDYILLSGHHYDSEIADKIRGSKSLFDREAFYRTLPNKDKFILSLNVHKPYLCTRAEILDSIMYFNKLGFKNIKLAELFNAEDMFVSIDELLGIKLQNPFAQGCSNKNVDTSSFLPEFDGNLTIKKVCFLRNKKLNPNIWDFLKMLTRNIIGKKYFFGVIHPDGNIYPYWV